MRPVWCLGRDEPPDDPAEHPDPQLGAVKIVVLERGVSGLTLEAHRATARQSKGGLPYHFATKEPPIEAMLTRTADLIGADFEASAAAQPEGPGRVARAVPPWGLEGTDDSFNRAAAMFLAAGYLDPSLARGLDIYTLTESERSDVGRTLPQLPEAGP